MGGPFLRTRVSTARVERGKEEEEEGEGEGKGEVCMYYYWPLIFTAHRKSTSMHTPLPYVVRHALRTYCNTGRRQCVGVCLCVGMCVCRYVCV